MNGFSSTGGMEPRVGGPMASPLRGDITDTPLGGLFTGLAKKQGGPPRLPAFPDILDMSSTKVSYLKKMFIKKIINFLIIY